MEPLKYLCKNFALPRYRLKLLMFPRLYFLGRDTATVAVRTPNVKPGLLDPKIRALPPFHSFRHLFGTHFFNEWRRTESASSGTQP
jgi:integrase